MTDDRQPSRVTKSTATNVGALTVGIGVWAALWVLTPGLSRFHPVRPPHASPETQILVETMVAAGLLIAIVLSRPATAHRLLGFGDRGAWWYVLPAVLAASVPVHYHLPLPVGLYLGWMAVSVLWQQYLTFGLLQDWVRQYCSPRTTMLVVALVFAIGHAALLPQMRPTSVPGILGLSAMLLLGLIFAGLKLRTGRISTNIVLHLTFYYVFC